MLCLYKIAKAFALLCSILFNLLFLSYFGSFDFMQKMHNSLLYKLQTDNWLCGWFLKDWFSTRAEIAALPWFSDWGNDSCYLAWLSSLLFSMYLEKFLWKAFWDIVWTLLSPYGFSSSNALYSANLSFRMSIFLLTPFDIVTISVAYKIYYWMFVAVVVRQRGQLLLRKTFLKLPPYNPSKKI